MTQKLLDAVRRLVVAERARAVADAATDDASVTEDAIFGALEDAEAHRDEMLADLDRAFVAAHSELTEEPST